MTPLRFGGGLNYDVQKWQADFEVRHTMRQSSTASLETDTASYTIVDVGVSYDFGSKPGEYRVSVRGTNLLDDEIRYSTSLLKGLAPQPGRSVMVGVQARF